MYGRSKLNIIEQEFKYAEKTEFWRLKEEEEMRRTIQVKRERALLDCKRIERARRIKEENRIRKGIISAVKNQPSADGAHQLLDMYVAPVCVCRALSPAAIALCVCVSLSLLFIALSYIALSLPHIHVCIHTYIYTHVRGSALPPYVCIHTHTYIYVCVCVCVYM